jgi:sporulation protein YlmC with PRC-barrel domain
MENLRNERIISGSTLKGTTVRTPSDEKIGEIKDVMLNSATGEVSYCVLSVDTGFLNLGSKYFAIPWQVLSFDNAQDDIVIFNVDKNRLEHSPGFDKDNWPSGPQMEFIDEVHSYYGISSERSRTHHQRSDRDFTGM